MKNTILAITFFIFGWSAPLSAEVMTYQGRLKESNVPVNANRVFSFKFCDAESFGNCDTTPSGFQSFTVQNGLFKSTFTIPASNLTQGEWYLQVSVGVDAPSIQDLSPRERLTAVPYSVYSATAGYSPAALQKAGDTMTGQLTSISSVTITGNGGVYGLQVSSNVSLAGALYSANGNVGIGTTTPQYPLVVYGSPAGNIINAGDAANPSGDTAGFGLDAFAAYPGAALYVNNAKVFNVESNGGAILGSTYMTADAVRNGLIVQGHVGIGTALPNYALEISSGAGEAGTIMSVSTGATNLFWVAGDGAHSIKFTGDGSGLTGITGAVGTDSSKVLKAGDTMTGSLFMDAGSTITVTGSDFSVGGSTFVVINGKVGIGTTNPQAKLDVDGGHAIFENDGSDINLYLKTKTAGAYLGNLFFLNYAGTGYGGVSGDQTNGRVNIWTGTVPGGNEKVTISSNGNVGIGTTGPNYRMHVSSGAGETGIIMAVSTGATNIFTVDGSGVNALRFTGDGSGLTGVTGASGTDSSKLPLTGGTLAGQLTLSGSTLTVTGDAFSVGGSTLVVTNGYVGLGTNAPAARLDVVSDNGYLHFRSPNTSLIMNMIPQTYAPAILNNNGDGPLGFSIANDVKMWIDRQTLVGIGTQTPAYRLHVSSAAGEAGIIMAVSTGITNVFWVDGSGANALKFTGDGSGLTGVTAAGAVQKSGDTMTGDLMMAGASTITVAGSGFSVGGSTFAVTYGRVGIGTAAPGRALDVQLPVGINDDGIRVTARSGIRLDLYSNQADVNARNWSLLSNNPRFGDFSVRRSNSMGGDPNLNGTTAMYLAREGNIGFSNDLPLYRLHVSSGAGEAGIVMAVSTGTSNIFWVAGDGAHATSFFGDGSALTGVSGTDDTKLPLGGGTLTGQLTLSASTLTVISAGSPVNSGVLWASTSTVTPALFVSTTGRVGIGSASPGYPLHVIARSGQVGIRLEGYDTSNDSIYIDSKNGGKPAYGYVRGSLRAYTEVDTSNRFNINVNSQDRLTVTPLGFVGINDLSPAYLLHVSTTAGETGTIMAVSTGATNIFTVDGSGVNAIRFTGDGSGLTNLPAPGGFVSKAGDTMIGQLTNTSSVTITGNGGGAYGLEVSSNISLAGALYSSNGNIGIGTLNPQYGLDIGSGTNGISQTMRIKVGGGGADKASILLSGPVYAGSIVYDAGNASNITIANTFSGADPFGNILFQTNGSTERLRITRAGNVGIGATAPDQKLTVTGNISQTGVLISSGTGQNYFAGDVTAARYQIAGSTVLAVLPGTGSMGIGPNAGRVNTADSNLFVGVDAGFSNDSGIANTFAGYQAGYSNFTGLANTFMGSSAGRSNTVGGNNSFYGNQAGFNNDGDGNAFFGSNAGTNNSGSNNVFIGANAGLNASGTGNIVVGYNKDTSVPAANNELNIGGVIYGDLSARTIGISTRAPQAALDIVSTATSVNVYAQIWRDSSGLVVASMTSTGRLSGDGSGLAGVSGSDATKLPLAGGTMTGNLTMGGMHIYSASTITASGDITAARYQIGGSTMVAILSGANSIAYGVDAGKSNSTVGNFNVFIGNYAGTSNTNGDNNTANGYNALYSNTTTGNNTANGSNALYSNTTGANNTANGSYALYSNTTGGKNTTNGANALYNNQTGSGDVVVGYQAGGYGAGAANSFSSSTVVGYQAGYNLSGGSADNTFLGWQAGYNVTTGAGNIVIGYDQRTLVPASNNSLNIGGLLFGDLAAKTIGISTRVPQAALDIVSTATSVNVFAQIWRDSTGLVVASMTSTGRLSGDGSGLSGVTVANGVYTAAANTFTNISAPVLIQPSGAPAADTKLFDMRPTGPGVTNFSVDSEGDVTTTGELLVLKTSNVSTSKLTLETDNNANNILELAKYGSSAGGSTAGGTILLANLSRVAAGATAGPLMMQVVSNNPMYFVTNDSERMRIAVGGNVGIASPSPTGLFQVGGGSLTVLASGKIGIGTTAPSRKLEVNGEITASHYEIGGSTVVAILSGTESLGIGVNAGMVNTGNYNVFVGSAAGYANTTAANNSYVGHQAGYTNTTGDYNTFMGSKAGFSNTAGYDNTYVGHQAGYSNTGGLNNSFMGYSAGYANTTGEANSIVGFDAGFFNRAGSANAILGSLAGYGTPANSFSSSTLVGYQAGYSLLNGSDNILVGFKAGYSVTTGTGNIVIGYGKDTSAPGANNELNIGGVLYGDLSARTIGISRKVPEAALDIVSTATSVNIYAQIWRDSTGLVVASMTSTGRLSGDGSGLTAVSANDATKLPLTGGTMAGDITMGGNDLYTVSTITATGDITAARYQIAGSTVLAVLPGTESLGVGVNAGRVNAGDYNTFMGASAGYSNTTGRENSFLGYSAGYNNTSGDDNSFMGYSAGYYNTAGVRGSFLGHAVGHYNTTGRDNSLMGYYAGYYNQTGSANAIFGTLAGVGVSNNSFSSSTLVGYQAGFSLGNGSADNIFVGFKAGYNVTSGTGNIVIGYGKDTSAPGANNELNIGGVIYGNLSAGYVGIGAGMTNPGGALQVGQNGLIISTGGAIQTTGLGHGSTAGNARGVGAVDLQTFRTAAGQVASGSYAVLSGGYGNTSLNYSFVGGGKDNSATGGYSVAGGGASNLSSNGWTTVAGGSNNVASQNNATVGGGSGNTAAGYSATVAGGSGNNVQSTALAGFIGGGGNNISTGAYSTVGGGQLNTSSGAYSAVLGGYRNVADGAYSGVAGGSSNRAYGVNSAVSGGNLNSAWGNFSTVSGGNNNSTTGLYSMIAGGDFNSAGGQGSAVVGGNLNNASGTSAFIGGGGSNEAKGWGAVVFGGNSAAMGGFSFAAGYRSTSAYDGSFTWSDSQGIDVVNNVQDQVMFKAKGGFWVSTGTIYANPALYIDASNNIGVGTAFPTAKLHLAVPGDGIKFPDGTLMTTASVGSASNLANITDAIINGDSDNNQSGSVKLQTSGLDRLYVSTNGNVGIGTIGPLVQFHNNGRAILASNISIDPDNYANSVIAGYVSDGGLNLTGIGGMATNAGSTWGIGHNNADLVFAVGDGTNPNTLQTFMQATWKRNLALVPVSGSVGIGLAVVTIPDQKLTVAGNISQTGVLISSGTGNNYFAGNVGIGTNTPVAMLDVNGTARLARHVVESRDSGGTMSADDFGKTITVNNASPQAIALPVGTAGSVGAQFTFVKLGTGKLTLNAGATDFIADSSMAGNIYNDAVSPAFATITLRLVTSNKWMLVGGEGAWVTQ